MADALSREQELRLAFLAGVAHDLKNPLSTLKLASTNCARNRSVTDATMKRSLELIDRQADRLDRMLSDLLDAASIEAGHLALRTEDHDVCALVANVVHAVKTTAPRHTFELELPSEPIRIACDSLRIEQVVTNLLSNAVKYSPRGGPIAVRVELRGATVAIAVADRGIGLTRDQIRDAFLPFRRFGSLRGQVPGAGIGLSVVRRIVDAHGGEIHVTSEPERGATFEVALPATGCRSKLVA
jgi:signal transduction histidine kinase